MPVLKAEQRVADVPVAVSTNLQARKPASSADGFYHNNSDEFRVCSLPRRSDRWMCSRRPSTGWCTHWAPSAGLLRLSPPPAGRRWTSLWRAMGWR